MHLGEEFNPSVSEMQGWAQRGVARRGPIPGECHYNISVWGVKIRPTVICCNSSVSVLHTETHVYFIVKSLSCGRHSSNCLIYI